MSNDIFCVQCNQRIFGAAEVLDKGIIHQKCGDAYYRAVRGLLYECPKCNKTGKIKDPGGRMEDKIVPLARNETPDCAYNGCWGCEFCRDRIKTVRVPCMVKCTLCNGEGYLKDKPEPVTAIVDWKLPKP